MTRNCFFFFLSSKSLIFLFCFAHNAPRFAATRRGRPAANFPGELLLGGSARSRPAGRWGGQLVVAVFQQRGNCGLAAAGDTGSLVHIVVQCAAAAHDLPGPSTDSVSFCSPPIYTCIRFEVYIERDVHIFNLEAISTKYMNKNACRAVSSSVLFHRHFSPKYLEL